jgi:hypothetical protein
MSDIYLKSLAMKKKKVSQQILNTKTTLKSLEKTLAYLEEQEKNFVGNREKYRRLNCVFNKLTRVCLNSNGANCPYDYYASANCVDDSGNCPTNNCQTPNKKRNYTRLDFDKDKLSESEIQFLREYVPLFTNAEFTVWPAHNYLTNNEKELLVTHGFKITQYTQ